MDLLNFSLLLKEQKHVVFLKGHLWPLPLPVYFSLSCLLISLCTEPRVRDVMEYHFPAGLR